MGLESVKEWLHYCPRCNSCKYIYRNYASSCPAFEKFRWECYTASGKVWMARDLFEGKYPLSESIRDKIFACTYVRELFRTMSARNWQPSFRYL